MHLLTQPFSRDGEFWLPETPNHKCFGQLSFDPRVGIELKLLGSLRQCPKLFDNPEIPDGLIHGRLETAKPVSLFGCLRTSHQLTFNAGFARERYRSNITAIGVHCASLKEKLFQSGTFSISGLASWFQNDWYPHSNFDQHTRVLSVQTQEPRRDIILKARGHSIVANRFSSIEHGGGLISISSKSDLKVQSSSVQSLDWYLRQSSALVSFLSFCLAQPTELETISVGHNGGNDERPFSEVEIIYAPLHAGKPDADKPALAPLSAIQDIKEVTKEWMSLHAKAKTAVRFVQDVQGDQLKYVNLRFLLAVQAAEVFHRELYGTKKTTLRSRIDSLVSELRAVLGQAPQGLNQTFRAKTVRTRHHYTHFSDVSRRSIFNSTEMYWASQRLAAMMIILSLHRIGVDADVIRSRVSLRDDLARILRKPGVP